MGNCASSCLGNRRGDVFNEDEESRLMFDDNGMQYGSFGVQHMNAQDDPLEVQRETEALQRVVARTSDNMVDIFEIAQPGGAPWAGPSSYAVAGQEARLARYQNLVSKLEASEELMADARFDWASQDDDDTIEMQRSVPPVKAGAGEPLVGNFADAARAVAAS